ncbi:hypothetical protein PVAND_006107 [Polypedilum vanderplanki]|uniref:Uncharacterized protein n=1 Tax=Polypedilum vanderplanki TaxID=319348 RepID=A0A9J6C365_POLVA|nr:hypothetical protein PVAND_006107 [Polypedilum vanderplanki]
MKKICAVGFFVLTIFCASTEAFICDYKDIENIHTCIIFNTSSTFVQSDKEVLRVVSNVEISIDDMKEILTNFPKLESLEILNGKFDSYRSSDFPSSCLLKNLQILRGQLVSLASSGLSACTLLTSINFSYNKLASVNKNAFDSFQSTLKTLNLADNKIDFTTSDIFTTSNSLPALESLNLSSNELSSFPQSGFAFPSTNLKKLDLSFNKFSTIANTILNLIPSLEELYLYNNSMTEISETQFSGLTLLKKLNIGNNNNISSIHKDAFKNNIALEVLNITRSTVTKLEKELLTPLTKLQNLDLQDIKIDNSSIENLKDILSSLTDLKYLNISLNKIGSIDGIFSSSKNLVELYINEIGLEKLSENSFDNLTKLEVISLNKNSLESFPDNIFKNTLGLKVLHASENKISQLKTSTFEKLEKLEYLDLSGNDIKGIEKNFFDKLKNLKVIKMSNNECLNEDILSFNSSSSLSKFDKCFDDYNSSPTLIISNALLILALLLKFV